MPDNQQQAGDEDLRNTVAADRQQINALQDQVNRLNDHIAEMEHNGDADSGSSADAQKLAALEQEVQALKGGAASTTPVRPRLPASPGAATIGAPSAPGGPTDANGNSAQSASWYHRCPQCSSRTGRSSRCRCAAVRRSRYGWPGDASAR